MEKTILRLDNVGYRYDDALPNEYVLKNMNYNFECGKIYAIKGKSGSGKTTLANQIIENLPTKAGVLMAAVGEFHYIIIKASKNTCTETRKTLVI